MYLFWNFLQVSSEPQLLCFWCLYEYSEDSPDLAEFSSAFFEEDSPLLIRALDKELTNKKLKQLHRKYAEKAFVAWSRFTVAHASDLAVR